MEYSATRKAAKRGKNRHVTFDTIYQKATLEIADIQARKGKKQHKGVRIFDRNPKENLKKLSKALQNQTYHTSPGHDCYRKCPCGKTRLLHKLPYYPDHIVHHAMMIPIMPVLVKSYYYDSSASIKGKGMHFAEKRIRRFIDENKDAGRLYFGKLDFVQFYKHIVQSKIYNELARKFSNKGVRYLLHEVITAIPEGLGIGLYPIQPLANYYTAKLCREVMANFKVRVFIYCDDIAVVGRDKKEVWKAINYIQRYAEEVLEQPLHDNIGVQIIDDTHCLDMIGYRFYLNKTLLRKRMMKKFCRKMHNLKDPMRRYQVAQSYKGWLMHCNGFNLWCKTMEVKSFKDMHIPTFEKRDSEGKRMLEGIRMSASMLADREIIFTDVELDVKSKYKKRAAVVQVMENDKKYKFFTCNQKLIEVLSYINTHDGFPFKGKLVRVNSGGLPDYEIQ